MEKFSRVLRGYNPEEVNDFLDKVISRVEQMVGELKEKDEKINSYKSMEEDYISIKQKLQEKERMEDSLKRAILMAERTSDQIRLTAHQERDIILNDAKKNASRIMNEALLKAEKVENETENLKRNVMVYKKKLKDLLETQLDLVDDIEKIEL